MIEKNLMRSPQEQQKEQIEDDQQQQYDTNVKKNNFRSHSHR